MIPDRINHLLKFNSDKENLNNLTISVYDLQGKCIQQGIAYGNKSAYSINFNHQTELLYLIKLTDEKNNHQNFKLIW